jgi:hypothetical protein
VTAVESEPEVSSNRTAEPKRRQWWVLLFAIYCVGFALFAFVRFIGFDQSLSTALPPRPEFPFQYPLLALHVIFGSIAMSLAWLQVWPWFRNNHPKIHRRIGWVYFLGGVIPSGLLAIPVAALSSAGQSLRMALTSLGVLWLVSTFLGFRAALQGRYDIHQRWMLRNVALTTSIITARPIFMLNFFGLQALLPDTYPADARHTFTESFSTGIWGSVLLHLVIVEWVVLRPRRRARRKVTTG